MDRRYTQRMRLPYYLWIAERFLFSRARQSLLTMIGVTLGVAIVTLMQSYIGGFLNFFVQRALASTPDVTVTQTQAGVPNPAGPVTQALRGLEHPLIAVAQLPIPRPDKELNNPRGAQAQIATLPDVTAVTPFVTGQGLMVNGDVRAPVNFLGVLPQEEAKITDFATRLVRGTPDELARRTNGIILGAVLAGDMSAEVGDRVTLISEKGVSLRLLVVGIYSSGLQQVDMTRAYVNLRQAQQLMAMRGVNGLEVKTTSMDTAVPVAQRIEAVTPYTARTWREVNSGFLDLFSTISIIIYLVVGMTMIVAGFGIANALILTVNEKQRDIGVLKAMGTPPAHVTFLFLATGILIGIVGVMLGELLGALGIDILAHTQIPIQPQGVAPVELQQFPMLRVPRVYLLSGAFGLLVSIAASVLPSLRAAKADPLPIIRGAE